MSGLTSQCPVVTSPAPRSRARRGSTLRPAAVSAGTFGSPVLLGTFQPDIGAALGIIEILTLTTVIATALFGSSITSDRAFRLLRWITNRAEPPAPPSATEGDDR